MAIVYQLGIFSVAVNCVTNTTFALLYLLYISYIIYIVRAKIINWIQLPTSDSTHEFNNPVNTVSYVQETSQTRYLETCEMYLEHNRFSSLHSLDIFYVWVVSPLPRSDTLPYLGWTMDVLGTGKKSVNNNKLFQDSLEFSFPFS